MDLTYLWLLATTLMLIQQYQGKPVRISLFEAPVSLTYGRNTRSLLQSGRGAAFWQHAPLI